MTRNRLSVRTALVCTIFLGLGTVSAEQELAPLEPKLLAETSAWNCTRSVHGTGDGVCKGSLSVALYHLPKAAHSVQVTCRVTVVATRLRAGVYDREPLLQTLKFRLEKETPNFAAGEHLFEVDVTSAAAPSVATFIRSSRCSATWQMD